MVKQFFAVLTCLLTLGLPGFTQTVNTFEGTLEVEVETLAKTPYAGEMVLIYIRGHYPDGITLEKLRKPEFRGTNWMELGVDDWADVRIEGKRWRAFERRMALFPENEGTLTIPPFVHELTFANRSGERKKVTFRSEPVSIEIAQKPALDGWWLPASDLRVTDSWATDPAQLAGGQIAERTIVIEALGIGPEGLPPAPAMRAPGLMTFVQPEIREHKLTPDGPLTSVTWTWKMRPATSKPGLLEPVVIPWFNTQTRTMEEVIIAPQRIAIVGADELGHWQGGEIGAGPRYSGVLIGAFSALVCAMIWILPGLRMNFSGLVQKWYRRLMPDQHLKTLKNAVRNRDVKRFRLALMHMHLPSDVLEHCTGEIDRHLFGTADIPKNLDLGNLASTAIRAYRNKEVSGVV